MKEKKISLIIIIQVFENVTWPHPKFEPIFYGNDVSQGYCLNKLEVSVFSGPRVISFLVSVVDYCP